jgi:hypothetical protein
MRTSFLGLATATVFAGTAFAGPNLVTNGNFEATNGSFSGTQNTQFGSGGYASVPNWTVTANGGSTPFDLWFIASKDTTQGAQSQYGSTNQDLLSNPSNPPTGLVNFVALDADSNATGILSQSISGLLLGQTYQLTFSWAASQLATASTNPYSAGLAFGLGTSLVTSSTGTGVQTTGLTSEKYGVSSPWASVTATFVATSYTEILSFLAYGTPTGGPPEAVLDNVGLTAVPEPASLTLFGGLAVLGLARRRALRRGR